MQMYEEIDYLYLMSRVKNTGQKKEDRTSVGSSTFINGVSLKFNLEAVYPIPSTRKVPFRWAFEETMFFLRGDTDSKILEDKGITIWKGNTSREFLNSRGLIELPEGSIGKSYSHQWRNFGGDLDGTGGNDQIKDMLENMKKDPFSRRHLFTGWNPQQITDMALPPCHLMNMYTITPCGRLNSSFIMRSVDLAFGLPFNIMSYALLNAIFAKYLGLKSGEMTFFGHDAHIYDNQMDFVEEWTHRNPTFDHAPVLYIDKELNTIEDIMSLEYSDVRLEGLDQMDDIENKPDMAV